MDTTRLLLADDHRIIRQGIRALLEMERDLVVVGEASSGTEVLSLLRETKPDILLLDVQMPGMGGAEVCRHALALHPDLNVVILTAFSSHDTVLQCVLAGAKGYVLKDVDVTELVKTIRAIRRGESVLDPRIAGTVMNELRRKPREESGKPALTHRELEIARLMSQGLTNQEIGWQLFLSTSTVKLHVRKIQEKLGVNSRTAAIYEASKLGLI